MQADEFGGHLGQDLPRGHALQPKSTRRGRFLFARWLTPSEMFGLQVPCKYYCPA